MKGQRRKKERRMCSCPVGTATKGIAHWYYHVWLLLSLPPLYMHWNYPCTVTFSEILLGQSAISPDISWSPLPPSVISLVCWNHLWDKLYFRDYWNCPPEFLDTSSIHFSVSLYSLDAHEHQQNWLSIPVPDTDLETHVTFEVATCPCMSLLQKNIIMQWLESMWSLELAIFSARVSDW